MVTSVCIPHRAGSAGLRLAIAAILIGASRRLDRLALRLAIVAPARAAAGEAAQLEFAREACADEGAVYVDGVLIGLLPGVDRL